MSLLKDKADKKVCKDRYRTIANLMNKRGLSWIMRSGEPQKILGNQKEGEFRSISEEGNFLELRSG